jgi:ELWxxDGT repeat protein
MKKITLTLLLLAVTFLTNAQVDLLLPDNPDAFSSASIPNINKYKTGPNNLFYTGTSSRSVVRMESNTRNRTSSGVTNYFILEFIPISDSEVIAYGNATVANGDNDLIYIDFNNLSNNQIIAPQNSGPDVNIGGTGMVSANGLIYLFLVVRNTTDGFIGRELVSIDPITKTMSVVKDITPGSFGTTPFRLQVQPGSTPGTDRIFFIAETNNASEREVWVSDGTDAGTFKYVDMAGAGNGNVTDLTVIGTDMYFSAFNGDGNGREAWYVDTTAPTPTPVNLGNLNALGNSDPRDYVRFNGKTYFTADDGVNGRELYVTENTAATTMRLNIDPTSTVGSNPTELTVSGNNLFFAARRGAAGRELIRMSATGSIVSYNINQSDAPNFPDGNGDPVSLFDAGDYLYFTADDGATLGYEPYRIDLDTNAMEFLADISANGSSSPKFRTVFDGDVVFTARHDQIDEEAYTVNNIPFNCGSVTNILIDSPGGDWMFMNWNNNGNSFTNHIIDIFPTNQNAFGAPVSSGNNEIINGTESGYAFGLNSNTNYNVYLKSYCTDGTFTRQGPFSITTRNNCPPFNNVSINNITSTTVDLSWSNTGLYAAIEILVYNEDAAIFEDSAVSTFGVTTSNNTFTITGLDPNTAYDIYIVGTCATTTPSSFTNFIFGKQQIVTATLSNNTFETSNTAIYPNPVKNSFSVKSSNIDLEKIEIYDVLGKLVNNLKPNGNNIYNISDLKQGLYFVKLNTKSGKTLTRKIIKE